MFLLAIVRVQLNLEQIMDVQKIAILSTQHNKMKVDKIAKMEIKCLFCCNTILQQEINNGKFPIKMGNVAKNGHILLFLMQIPCQQLINKIKCKASKWHL